MTGSVLNVAVFLLLTAPLYVAFLRMLKRLSRQKIVSPHRLPGGASQS